MSYKHISVQQTQSLIENGSVVVADIRDANSFNHAHIEGAVNLTNENLQQFMLERDFEDTIIVVCYHGISSVNAANYLAEQGFEDVYTMDGGFEAWSKREPTA